MARRGLELRHGIEDKLKTWLGGGFKGFCGHASIYSVGYDSKGGVIARTSRTVWTVTIMVVGGRLCWQLWGEREGHKNSL